MGNHGAFSIPIVTLPLPTGVGLVRPLLSENVIGHDSILAPDGPDLVPTHSRTHLGFPIPSTGTFRIQLPGFVNPGSQ